MIFIYMFIWCFEDWVVYSYGAERRLCIHQRREILQLRVHKRPSARMGGKKIRRLRTGGAKLWNNGGTNGQKVQKKETATQASQVVPTIVLTESFAFRN